MHELMAVNDTKELHESSEDPHGQDARLLLTGS